MRNYDRAKVPVPKDIGRKKAHIIGGGIAGFATAAFLVEDCGMPGENITIYEADKVNGGCLDAHRLPETAKGYRNRGSRMWEHRYECTYYLLEKIPSLDTPGLSVLDETVQANKDHPFHARTHLMHKRGEVYKAPGPLMSPEEGQSLMNLLLTPEEDLNGKSCAEFFPASFFESDFWYNWAYIFALAPQHSVIECRRYLNRFAMYLGQPMLDLTMLIHTKYNEYDAVIRPTQEFLKSKGVKFRQGTKITDIETVDQGRETLATALVYDNDSGQQRLELSRDDLVFFTNGSMVHNTNWGENDTVATYNRDTSDLGLFDVWAKLAKRNPKFGTPKPFISDIEGSGMYTWTATLKGKSKFIDYWQKKTGVSQPLITNAFTTFKDAAWKGATFVYGTDYYRDQPADVNVMHGYVLFSDRPGDFVKKPIRDCTGNEVLTEILYHYGLDEDTIKETVAQSYVSVVAMPYITSQFMPRKVTDRPQVIPEGCVNLAFIGQYVETPADVSFTVESSVRTAMIAAYGLTGLDKPVVPQYEPIYDVKVIAKSLEMAAGRDVLTLDVLEKVRAGTGGRTAELLDAALQKIPEPVV